PRNSSGRRPFASSQFSRPSTVPGRSSDLATRAGGTDASARTATASQGCRGRRRRQSVGITDRVRPSAWRDVSSAEVAPRPAYDGRWTQVNGKERVEPRVHRPGVGKGGERRGRQSGRRPAPILSRVFGTTKESRAIRGPQTKGSSCERAS